MAGDLRAEALPGGHDLAFVSAIVRVLGPAENVGLLRGGQRRDALVEAFRA